MGVHIIQVSDRRDGDFRCYYQTPWGRDYIDVYATDSLGAFAEARRILEEKEMNERWIFCGGFATFALLILSIASCQSIGAAAERNAEVARAEACVKSGRSYASNINGYVCAPSVVIRNRPAQRTTSAEGAT